MDTPAVTVVDSDRFATPVKRIGVSGGTAPFFALALRSDPRPAAYFIGKDLSHAEGEVGFYEEALALQKLQGHEGLQRLLSFMLEYEGVVTLLEEGTGVDRRLLVMRNLFEGCARLRLADLKIGEQTAVANWQGKSRFGAMKQSIVDGLTNSALEGFRLEGFDGPPPNITSMDPFLSLSGESSLRMGDRQARRVLLQNLSGLDVIMHLLDTHQEPADPGAEALGEVVSPIEVAEIVHCEMVNRLLGFAIACRGSPVPQKWIGSSIALAFDAGRLPARGSAQEEIKAAVQVQIFDWGRSELNTAEKHSALLSAEQEDRQKFWNKYRAGIDRLLWDMARSYRHRFTSCDGWRFLRASVIDFDVATSNSFIGYADLPLEECGEKTVPLLNGFGYKVTGKDTSTLTYAMEYRALPEGSRIAGVWRIHLLRATHLSPMDAGVLRQSADPFVELTAFSEVPPLGFEIGMTSMLYMWMWGDENPLATFNPLRWSEYMSPKDMAEDIRRCTTNNNRPIKVKDQCKGNWGFKNPAQAIYILGGGHVADEAKEELIDENRGRPHLRFRQQTSIKARTLDPEWGEFLELPVAASSISLQNMLDLAAPEWGDVQRLLPHEGIKPEDRETAFLAWIAHINKVAAA